LFNIAQTEKLLLRILTTPLPDRHGSPWKCVKEEKLMRNSNSRKVFIPAFLLVIALVGCGDKDVGGSPTSPTATPTVLSVTPNGALLCPNNAPPITATFSKPMNSATISNTTFTLTSGGANVSGTVTYVAATMVATFTPSGNLAPSTLFTATITTGAQDTFGNALAANKVWTFTTPSTCGNPPPVIALGAACSFGILGATPVVSNVGPTIVTGDVGIWPALSITGFPPGTVASPGVLHPGDSVAMAAQGALTTAYNTAAGTAGGAAITADIGGQTLPAGVYKATTTLGITGILTLDGGGNPNASWIFQVGSALTTAAGGVGTPASQVKLIGSASAHNVFWETGSAATLGTNSIFAGTIMAKSSITLGTGATLNGRALAETGAVTMDSNPVNVPPCP
jgi:hypothetical protein